MQILIATVVHHPEDARILHRQARALVDAGHQVVHLAPFTAFGALPRPWVTSVDVPRASGRARGAAIVAARQEINRLSRHVDLVLVHDPELLLAVMGQPRRLLPPVVWDVHEDTAAALGMKGWVPAGTRPLLRGVVALAERWAEHRLHLVLAEHGYARRFRRPHLVVPNHTTVPAVVARPGDDRVVYVGHLSRARGVAELIEVARRLAPHGVRTELIGPADAESRALLECAEHLTWHGFLPNDRALDRVEGALAGLSLLHDEPNYRHSMPTKVIEYMARGVPVVTTPLPEAAGLVQGHDCGAVVPFADPAAAADAVLRLRADAELRTAQGARGHAAARRKHHWPESARAFVSHLEGLGRPARTSRMMAW